MKLQKLVYFAQGLSLALSEGKERLVRDSVEAWKFGPVFPSIYSEFSYFGANPITRENNILSFMDHFERKEITLENELHQQIINETWNTLKKISGIELSNWTHAKDSAWSKSYEEHTRGIVISDEDIIEDFKPFIK